MALQLKDRVQETSVTEGTGSFAMEGAVTGGFVTFGDVITVGNTTPYAIVLPDENEWEVGIGTWGPGNTLARTTVQASSNSNNLVDFSEGTKYVFGVMPATLLQQIYDGEFTSLTVNPTTTGSRGLTEAILTNQWVTGAPATSINLNHLKIWADNADAGTGFVNGVTVDHYFGGSAMKGGREAFAAYAYLTEASNAANSNWNYVGVTGVATASATDGGTGTGFATSKGGIFGGGFVGVAANGAINLANVTGAEFNAALQTGSSVYAKSIIQLSGRTDDAVQGSEIDAMIWLYKQGSSAVVWSDGILFDYPADANAFPFDDTSTVFRVGAGTVLHGIDLNAVTFATGGMAYRSPGYRVDGLGRIGQRLAPQAGNNVDLRANLTGDTTSSNIRSQATIQSDVTVQGNGMLVQNSTAAAAFTLAFLDGYVMADGTLGAGSAITNQRGFVCNDLTLGTNVYGIYSAVSSGSTKWNFYATGTAQNAFAGPSKFGATTAPTSTVDVAGSLARTYRVATADITVGSTDSWLVNNKSGSANVVTLPSAASFPNREIMITNWQAQTVDSGSSNVIPLGGGSAGTSILTGVAGKWCTLVSNSTNWVITQGVI